MKHQFDDDYSEVNTVLSQFTKTDSKAKRLCVLYKGCGVFPHAWDIAGGTETEFELSPLADNIQDSYIQRRA